MRIRFHVAYEGTDFCGWQRQNSSPIMSVQQTIEEALSKLFQQKVILFASGRTDAGVHARAQVCHFDLDADRSRFENWDMGWALRALLPPSISLRAVWEAPPDFHATLSATHKTYRYFIYNNPRMNPFWRRSSHWMRHPLELERLQSYPGHIIGTHDFKSFQTTGSPVPHTVRDVYEAVWDRPSANLLRFTITGSGFLKQMVRNIVGTQLLLHKHRAPPERMGEILRALDRRQAGPSAPPEGLFLWKVFYPRDLDKRCRPL